VGGNPGSKPRAEKPLDTDREKYNLIEDIVVDNPREGALSVATAGIGVY
jgi:hypothetical protein